LKHLTFISIIALLLFSCEAKEEIIVNESELIPTGNEPKVIDENQKTVTYRDTLPNKYRYITDSLGFVTDYTGSPFVNPFIARFGPKKAYYFAVYSGKDSLHYSEFHFKDSVKAKTAFFNWLDRFGDREIILHMGEEAKVSKQHLLILVNEKSIYTFQGSIKIKSDLIIDRPEFLKTKWKYIIEQPARMKTKWFTVDEEKIKTTIKPIPYERVTPIK
jgi:hypothetical protein